MPDSAKVVTAPRPVESLIRLIRGQKVMLDADLAALYEVPTKRLNGAVKRNLKRFPETFMFRLSREEAAALRSQNATLETRRVRYPKYPPLALPDVAIKPRPSGRGYRATICGEVHAKLDIALQQQPI